MIRYIYSRPGIRPLVLLIPILALVSAGLLQLYSRFETVQAAVSEQEFAPAPDRLYLPMQEPTVLASAPLHLPMEKPKVPAEEVTAAVVPTQSPEKKSAAAPEKTPVPDNDKPAAAKTCNVAECKYYALVIRASKRHQVEPALIAAIIKAESGYNPRAVSQRGAKGLMQLMPPTAAELGVENSFDPEHNINGGVRYYKMLLKRYDGNIELALAAYNAGMQTVKKYNGIPPFKATRHYIKKVLHYYRIYQETLVAAERPDQNLS